MTFQPPQQPPGGTPPPPPPPPPGQWGPPPGGGYPAPHSGGFDPKTVNSLDWGIVGAGVLAFLFSFIDFYSGVDVTYAGRTVSTDAGSASAWNDVVGGGFFAWFAMVFAVVGAAVVAMELFAPQVKLPIANRLAGLVLFAAAALFEIIAIFVTPSSSYLGVSADANHGFGFWVSLIVILAGLVLSLMRLQQTGGKLPGALANMPNIGGHGPQGGPGAGTPPPPPAPGYGPPPNQGYGPPPGQ